MQRSQVASVYTYIYISVTVSVAPSVSLSGPLGRGAVAVVSAVEHRPVT